MIKKVVSDLKVRYYILVIPLPEKGVNLSLRFKKYVYVTLMTSAMWLLLLYFIKPSVWTILFSILYLSVEAAWYFEPTQSGECGSIGVGLTFNYAALLVSISIFVLMSVFNFGVEDATLGLIATVIASIFIYVILMFEVDSKEWDWLEFKFKKFGMESNGIGYLYYSEDRQDWGLQYGINMLAYLLSTVFIVICLKYRTSIFELLMKDYPILFIIGITMSVLCCLVFILAYVFAKNKYKKLVYFNRAFLFIIVYAYSIVIQNIVFLWTLLTIAILKILVSKLYKYKVKELVHRNINLANLYPCILILVIDMIIVRSFNASVGLLLVVGVATLVIFIILVATTNTKLFEVQEAFGYILKEENKYTHVDIKRSVLYKAYIMHVVCVSLIYFSIFSIYTLVFRNVSVLTAIPVIFGVFLFLFIVIKTFVTLSKKEEE